MAPDVSFHLTNDAYDRFAELLLPYGITVRDTWRNTSENLERGAMESDSYMGFLHFGGFEFRYHRHKSIGADNDFTRAIPRDNPNVQVFTTYFDVTWMDHDPKVFAQLEALLTTAFTQPKRPTRILPRPHPATRARILKRFGCLLVVLIFSAVCFFAVYGIRAFFITF